MDKFSEISEHEIAHRMQMKRSKQAIIAGKLLRIRAEMRALDSQLKAAKAHSEA